MIETKSMNGLMQVQHSCGIIPLLRLAVTIKMDGFQDLTTIDQYHMQAFMAKLGRRIITYSKLIDHE